MILSIVGYGLLVSALAALAAWLAERAQAAADRPRKHAWIGGMSAALLVPALVFWLREPGESVVTMLATVVDIQPQGAAAAPAARASPGGEAVGSLNAWLAALWALTSALLIGAYAFSAWRLARHARAWRATRVGDELVIIAPDIGPAVFGWKQARVLFPRWLIDAPEDVQRLSLAHEREHLDARDPQVLMVATLLGALLPWNLPLLWMLRRLRFAMEVDCDSRVIRRGDDPHEYGLALLYVSERQSRAPITAIALIERTSQLERRINYMFATRRKHPALVAGACLALAGSCLFAAAQLQAPALAAASAVLKPPPGGANSPGFLLGQKFELLLRDRYPELLRGEFTGTPIVAVLMNGDMTVANSAQAMTIPTDGKQAITKELFGVLGLAPEEVPYSGAMNMQLPDKPDKHVVIAYTERGKAGDDFVSEMFPDTRKLDRELFAQEFPEARSGIAAGENPWMLLDRRGAMLRKGIEPITPQWEKTLEKRFAGIETREMTVTGLSNEAGETLRDVAGKNVHLHLIWLAPESPLPSN